MTKTETKTGRIYGEKTERVLEIAQAKGTITRTDLGGEMGAASAILRHLHNAGKLTLVAKGKNGWNGHPAIYAPAGGAK